MSDQPSGRVELDDETFRTGFLKALEELRLTDEQVGDILHVGRTTIQRWKVGQNLPYRTLRGVMLAALVKGAPTATKADKPTTPLDKLKRQCLSTLAGSTCILSWALPQAPAFLLDVLRNAFIEDETDYVFLIPPAATRPRWLKNLADYDTIEIDVGDGFTLVLA